MPNSNPQLRVRIQRWPALESETKPPPSQLIGGSLGSQTQLPPALSPEDAIYLFKNGHAAGDGKASHPQLYALV